MRYSFALGILPCLALQSAIAASPEETAAQSVNAFAFDLYGRLAGEEGNLFLSPFSISVALSMTHAGAQGDTAQEMVKVLHLPDDPHWAFAGLLEGLAGDDRPYRLHIANALWLQDRYKFLPGFLETTEKRYGAGLFTVDYVGETEKARQRINAWVEEQTEDKIQELIGQGVLDASTRLVLTNAIYFKGTWKAAFDAKRTQDQPFHVAAGKSVTVPLMSQQGTFGYMKAEGLQALELPYTGDRLSMVVLLPDEGRPLAELEKDLTAEKLAEWIAGLKAQPVLVAVPRFKATSQFELSRPLAELGMEAPFSGAADFSGMTGSKELFISAVVHKAFADVNEEGTEAAAATAVVMMKSAAGPRRPVFRADRPFVFLIRDVPTGAILFLGRLNDPSKE